MEFKKFIDRKEYLERVEEALKREKPQFIVIYGRRRIGKSKLIMEIMDWNRKDIYFLSDQTNEANQRMLFAKTAAMGGIEDFDKVTCKKLSFSAIRYTKAA
ncbi:ATP-binding protein [uncultured Bacteroides sp.]|uniref:ATP-binding protein n=1 Tax=uncultured Bacteroides sp. TaxID=162156 RepID=UPI002594FB3C|nr:ATP-binding protein [uncultured Bacteroides sp.]